MISESKRVSEENGFPKTKKSKIVDTIASSNPIIESFATDLLENAEVKESLKNSIENSGPYKHGVIRPLINDKLLRSVREEIMNELHFTKKETDIYKVNQTGDLANLSGLDSEELSRLSSLAKLREAMYSKEFREYLSYVAQSGPLSGSKQDMSINLYDKGCHLLNHDDVIGSRRISYILYLTNPDEPWKQKWGGALRLYPTVIPNIPAADWTVSLPPAWNQLSFFTVQPGLSFHDVEEVFFDKPRLSISGWFHIPQPGEEGFIEGEQEQTEARSSLRQLQSLELLEHDFPKKVFDKYDNDSDLELTDDDKTFLKKYLNPEMLTPEAIGNFNETFCEGSMLSIKDFLNPEFAEYVKSKIDVDDLSPSMPKKSTEVKNPWKLAGPPHKMRYLYLGNSNEHNNVNKNENGGDNISKDVQAHIPLLDLHTLFKHNSFRKWLKAISSLTPTESYVSPRRFRPGYDFTLATTHESADPVLEATLSLTPSKGWEDGELGGYDLCMSVDETENDDPAVYKSANKEEEGDSVLFTNQADWNVFHLIVRDQGLLRFVKYVSKSAPGSRWDIAAEWKVEKDEGSADEERKDENT